MIIMQNNILKSIPTIYEIKNILYDEEKCEAFLFEKKILYPKPNCHQCHGPTRRENKCWRCIKKACKRSISINKGSFFEKTKLKYTELFMIAYLWLSEVPPKSIKIITGHSNNTIGAYIKYLNELIQENVNQENCIIGGKDIEVELDECKISKRKYNRGHHIEGAWIFGGVERTPERRIFVQVVPDRSSDTLIQIIQEKVFPKSVILTDCWKGYSRLNQLDYTHKTVNHSRHFKDPITLTHTNGIEGRWSGIKRKIPIRNRNVNSVESHILGYIWRHQNKGKLWISFIEAMSNTTFS
jgi:transposase-like protein